MRTLKQLLKPHLNPTVRGMHESRRNLDQSRPACKQDDPADSSSGHTCLRQAAVSRIISRCLPLSGRRWIAFDHHQRERSGEHGIRDTNEPGIQLGREFLVQVVHNRRQALLGEREIAAGTRIAIARGIKISFGTFSTRLAITQLEKVRFVMKDGDVVKNDLR